MNILSIVNHLRAVLPVVSSAFSDVFEIETVLVSSGVGVVTTATPHGLRVGELASITGVAVQTPIVSAVQEGIVTTFGTSADHDITENFPDMAEVELVGFTDNDWNGTFNLGSSPNRRAFTVATIFPEPVLNGNEVLLERTRIGGVNGLFPIIAVTNRTFSFATDASDGAYETTGALVSGSPLVTACATPDRAKAIYDERRDDIGSKAFCFVIPEGGTASKDRTTESDAVSARVSGDDLRAKIVDDFTIAVYLPTEKQLGGERAIGRFTSDILHAIVTSLFGLKVESPFACGGEYKVAFVGHELLDYDVATMVWGYSFQVPTDLTIDDAVIQYASRAFRDLDITVNVGNSALTVLDVDLDDEPLA